MNRNLSIDWAVVCAAAVLVASVALVDAQNPTMLGHPEDYPRVDIEHGARLYAENCDRCHGANGNGVSGVDLRSGRFRDATTDQQLRTVITNGFPTLGMPALVFDTADLTGLVAGDNLYTASVVALDLDTGTLKWHYQFTRHDRYDYDSVQVPVLVDITFKGAPLKAMLWANRNGNFYVLNRETGKFMLGKPFVKVNWMSAFDANGKPIQTPQPPGMPTYPAVQGGTNWYSPSYSPRTKLMYVSTWQDQGMLFGGVPVEYKEGGRGFGGGNLLAFVPAPGAPSRASPGAPGVPNLRRGPINNWTDAAGHGAVLAIDPGTGEPKWRARMTDLTAPRLLTTPSGL